MTVGSRVSLLDPCTGTSRPSGRCSPTQQPSPGGWTPSQSGARVPGALRPRSQRAPRPPSLSSLSLSVIRYECWRELENDSVQAFGGAMKSFSSFSKMNAKRENTVTSALRAMAGHLVLGRDVWGAMPWSGGLREQHVRHWTADLYWPQLDQSGRPRSRSQWVRGLAGSPPVCLMGSSGWVLTWR